MRTLDRNKSKIFYALYKEKSEILDQSGYSTGTYKIVHSNPVELLANVSSSSGTADKYMYGIDQSYDKSILVDDISCPISETSILWVDNAPTIKEDGSTDTPYDYIVKKVSRSLNVVAYAIQKVNVS
ncbi:MAG: hypothetical protein WCS30_14230 [Selenomonadaceae bacterium]